jgi:hypothetical protein
MSIMRMHEAFLSLGWSVEVLDKDYGEDLLIRIFEDGEATPYTFYVQAKSAESLTRYSKRDGAYVRYPIDFDHVRHWNEFWDPVFLMLWDRQADTIFWDMIQEPVLPLDMSGKKAKLLVPKDQQLDHDGLMRIRRKTRARHKRFQHERAGADVLVETLSEAIDAQVEYDAQSGLLFIERTDGEKEMHFFGELLEMISRMAESRGSSMEDVVRDALANFAHMVKKMSDGAQLEIRDQNGTVKRFNSIQELGRYIDDLDVDFD